jgi:hypothetical protein
MAVVLKLGRKAEADALALRSDAWRFERSRQPDGISLRPRGGSRNVVAPQTKTEGRHHLAADTA